MSRILAILSLTICAIVRPHHVACPAGWTGWRWMRGPVLYCQSPTPEAWHRGPRGGWIDDSEPGITFALRSYDR